MNVDDVRRLAAELELDAVGVARAEAYTNTERHIVERLSRPEALRDMTYLEHRARGTSIR